MADLPPPDLGGFNLWDWAGAAIGTVISIVYSRPSTRTDFIARVIVSLGVGGTFSFWIVQAFGWPDTARHAFAGGVAAAFFAYAALGVGFKLIKNLDKLPK